MIVAGLAVWMHIVGILPRIRMSHARRAGYALGLLAVNMLVSEVLFLRDPLYSVYVEQSDRLLGLSPTADQTRAALHHDRRADAHPPHGGRAARVDPRRPRGRRARCGLRRRPAAPGPPSGALSGSPRRIGATGRPRRHSAARRRGRRHRRRCPAGAPAEFGSEQPRVERLGPQPAGASEVREEGLQGLDAVPRRARRCRSPRQERPRRRPAETRRGSPRCCRARGH